MALGVSHSKDNDHSVRVIRWVLKPIGVWPLSHNATRLQRFVSELLVFLCTAMIVGFLVPCTLGTFLESSDMRMKLKAIGPINLWVMAALKYWSLLFHADNIRLCLQHIEIDWLEVRRMEDRDVMIGNARVGRYMACVCFMCMHTGIFSYDLIKGLSSVVILVGNDTVTLHVMPYPFYSRIVNTLVSPAHEIVFGFQCLSTFVVNSVVIGACCLAAVLVMHACGQLCIIISWLENILHKEESETRLALADIVKHHLRVLSFISRIEEIMHQICLVQLLGCTINLCLLGYYLIMDWQDNEAKSIIAYSIIFLANTFNIFIYCYIGETLSEQCRQVGEMAYQTEWYRLPKDTALGLILIISNSRNVIKITAGKLVDLSFVTFGNVMKTSMVYLNILYTAIT